MGQYYYVVNLDKKQYLHPHRFGDGLKLLEFGCSAGGTMSGLAILLADGNGRGGGDLRTENPIVGSWAGDRIVVAGDYADQGRFDDSEDNIFCQACDETGGYEDISAKVIRALADDEYLAKDLKAQHCIGGGGGSVYDYAMNNTPKEGAD